MTVEGGRDSIMARLLAGDVFAGYEIQEVIGRGGMGVIYRAAESQPAQSVALKVVARELASDEDFRRRFLHEAQIAASIEHPNVVPVLRVGEQDGQLFIAMRLIAGRDLAAVIRGSRVLLSVSFLQHIAAARCSEQPCTLDSSPGFGKRITPTRASTTDRA